MRALETVAKEEKGSGVFGAKMVCQTPGIFGDLSVTVTLT